MVTEEKEERRGELLIWDFPPELKAKFKAKCALKKLTMKEVVVNLIKKFCS